MSVRAISREHAGRVHGVWRPAGEWRILLPKGTLIYQDLAGAWWADVPLETLRTLAPDDLEILSIKGVEVLRDQVDKGVAR